MKISFPTDRDGFISQQCPSCEQHFKVCFDHGAEEPISYCPYCGYNGQKCWHTNEQIDYVKSVAAEVFLIPELKKIGNSLRRTSTSFLNIDVKSQIPKPSVPPMENDDTFPVIHFPCCNETIKAVGHQKHFCIICGLEVDMLMNASKKVFMSHKGVDKNEVREYKETLKALGYETWIDEEAMPAGTQLERGLLKGMKDSCGVIFFITPSFKDTGYLETEVNYAIQEKRSKGDKFAIITLQFVDEHREVGEIPDLLKTYVWKKPKNSLEAIREIVRALPIEVKLIDWRETIEGVISTPIAKSTTTQLSEEAKSILQTAASGDGQIKHLRLLSGEHLEVNGRSILPNDNARTIAVWLGGLEDLQRRRYIKDISSKGESFEVTREGYEFVDSLS